MVNISIIVLIPQVVFSGLFRKFHVVFFPLEYFTSIPPHNAFVIVYGCFTWRATRNSARTPVERKQHEMHKKTHWRLLLMGSKLWQL